MANGARRTQVTFSGEILSPLQVPEFLQHVLQLSRKTFSCIFFLAEMLLFRFLAFIVQASIFCIRFSQKQSANQLNWKAHAKILALLKEKNFTWKSHLHQSCTEPFNYCHEIVLVNLRRTLDVNNIFSTEKSHICKFMWMQVVGRK